MTYKPGTVAKATVRGVPDVLVFRHVDTAWVSAEPINEGRVHGDPKVTDVRPLVVLDFDAACPMGDPDLKIRDLLATLRGAIFVVCHDIANQIERQAVPPRIPEPGLWGVVEAKVGGESFTFVNGGPGSAWVCVEDGASWEWSRLTDPTLIRPGIEDAQ